MAAMGRSGRVVPRQCNGAAVQLDLRRPVSRLGMARAVLAQHRHGRDRTLHPARHSRDSDLHPHHRGEARRARAGHRGAKTTSQARRVDSPGPDRSTRAVLHIFAAFVFTYGTTMLHSSRDLLLAAVMCATALSAVTIPLAGHLSDRFGRKRMYLIGISAIGIFTFVYFALLNTAIPAVIFAAIILSFIPHDLAYGPQAALIAEVFAPRLRYSGSSLGFHLASIIAGGPAPLIATALFAATGSGYAVALYIAFCAVVSISATAFLPDYTNRDISQEHDIRSAASTAA